MPRFGARNIPFTTPTGLKISTVLPAVYTLKSTLVGGTPPDRLIEQPLQMRSPVTLKMNTSDDPPTIVIVPWRSMLPTSMTFVSPLPVIVHVGLLSSMLAMICVGSRPALKVEAAYASMLAGHKLSVTMPQVTTRSG